MELYGKDSVVTRLGAFRSSGRFPHALLLCGEKGIGKKVMADYAAMLYLCEKGGEKPCFSCRECERVEGRVHPDIVYMDCDGLKIKEDMRPLVKNGYRLPNDGDVRVYVMYNFEKLSVGCQNVLLKFIEEPLDFNRFVLTANGISGILPTILSRVVRVDLPLPSVEECEKALIAGGISPDRAFKLSRVFNGNIGSCLRENEANGSEDAGEDGLPRVPFGCAKDLLKALLSSDEYSAAVSLQDLSAREEFLSMASLLLEMLRDGIAYLCGSDSRLSFDKSAGEALGQRYGLDKLYACAETAQEYMEFTQIYFNLNIMENAFISQLFEALKG